MSRTGSRMAFSNVGSGTVTVTSVREQNRTHVRLEIDM